MNKKIIRNEYKKKIRLIKNYNKKYYNDNLSAISDSDYDKLKKEVVLLEKKYNFLKDKNSPSKIVGHKPLKHFKKALHRTPMLSLGNAFSEEDLINLIEDYEILIAGTEPISSRVIESAKNLKLISRVGIGLDNIDLLYCKKKNIKVTYTPNAPAPAVAELTSIAI